MPNLTLYRVNGSCAFVAHAVLLHFGIPFTTVEMKFGPNGVESADGTISHAEYLKVHHKGYVPALDVDGEVITELPAILNYISSLIPERKLFSDEGLGRARVSEWLNWLSGSLHALGFGMAIRPARFSDEPAALDSIQAKGKAFVRECFAKIDGKAKDRDFLVGDDLTAADFYVYIFSRWAGVAGIDLKTEYANYYLFVRRMESVEAVRKAIEAEGLEFKFL
ncbi:glutathione S-transferase [Dactylonectria estremocensis]|uniref:Glutathione S-transferase n=1 Tax=Dactylonectria estremocensis TaxID=1079267 RepID=A0A9P9JAH8_9HYPO|nr:glutathione S-transferase [Dactylonectria estremocensis]